MAKGYVEEKGKGNKKRRHSMDTKLDTRLVD